MLFYFYTYILSNDLQECLILDVMTYLKTPHEKLSNENGKFPCDVGCSIFRINYHLRNLVGLYKFDATVNSAARESICQLWNAELQPLLKFNRLFLASLSGSNAASRMAEENQPFEWDKWASIYDFESVSFFSYL